jgi:NTE family protein
MRFRILAFVLLLVFAFSCAPTKEVVQPPKKEPVVALVLGAGASRGFAHVGVLKVLENNHIPVNMVVGTSAGSFVGSLFAYGLSAYQIQKIAIDIQKGDIADVTIPDNGFIKGDKLEAYVNRMVNNTPIEKMRIPFYAVATNIQTGREVVFARGNTGQAVRASCSIPGVFRPTVISGQMYVDGGVVSPVAVGAARRLGADVVIAVDISSDLSTTQPEGTINTLLQSVNIMYSRLSAGELEDADVVIRPKVGYIASGDFEKRHEAIMEGEKAATDALPQIRDALSKFGQ